MESSDFYLKEFTNRNFSSYDKKYIQGKNVIDCRLEDYIFLKYLKNIKSNVKVLEVGFFSQRITKKLRKYFQVIFSTEYSSQMLDPKNHNQLLFDWAKNKIDKDLPKQAPFDVVISIGHQLSFSCDIEKGLLEISKLINKGGLIIFDIWNDKLNNSFDPSYKLQKLSIFKVNELI